MQYVLCKLGYFDLPLLFSILNVPTDCNIVIIKRIEKYKGNTIPGIKTQLNYPYCLLFETNPEY